LIFSFLKSGHVFGASHKGIRDILSGTEGVYLYDDMVG